jgi:hypothetical protein
VQRLGFRVSELLGASRALRAEGLHPTSGSGTSVAANEPRLGMKNSQKDTMAMEVDRDPGTPHAQRSRPCRVGWRGGRTRYPGSTERARSNTCKPSPGTAVKIRVTLFFEGCLFSFSFSTFFFTRHLNPTFHYDLILCGNGQSASGDALSESKPEP